MAETNIKSSDRRILMVGKTGSGKSSSGNVILSMEEDNKDILQYFKTGFAEQLHTYYNETYMRTILGRNLTVMDTPGLNSQADQPERIASEVRQAIEQSTDGYHAIVYVTNVFKDDLTLNDEEIETFNEIHSLLGDKFMDFVVLLFTHGDSYEEKLKPSKQMSSMIHHPKLTFAEVISRDECSTSKYAIGPYVRRVNGRAVLFENLEPESDKRKDMVQELLSKVDEIYKKEDGVCFVKDMLPEEPLPVLVPDPVPVDPPQHNPNDFCKVLLWKVAPCIVLIVTFIAICVHFEILPKFLSPIFTNAPGAPEAPGTPDPIKQPEK